MYFFLSLHFFPGGRGEDENGEPHYDGRAPRGFAGKLLSGTGNGRVKIYTESQLSL